LVPGILRNRPSKRNRSPYVADVYLETEDREAICHVPNLDMGGKCVPGAMLLMKPARDKKGNLIGKEAVSPKFGTPKCEFIAQLLYVDELGLGYEPTWVGAHPSLGEKIAEELVAKNLLGPGFPKVKSFQREVRNVGGADMRADFVIEHEDESLPPRILEVKTVVDTDYSTSATPERTKCVFTSDREPYERTAIFPWGGCNQKGPDGENVVSARAIKHVRELTRLSQTRDFDATLLFVVIRNDAKAFRPNHEACPSFARYVKEAEDAGVQVLAKQVFWGEGVDIGKCFEGPLLDIAWPEV
jgi:DNA-binding sugar fermentation-stimulating protein